MSQLSLFKEVGFFKKGLSGVSTIFHAGPKKGTWDMGVFLVSKSLTYSSVRSFDDFLFPTRKSAATGCVFTAEKNAHA